MDILSLTSTGSIRAILGIDDHDFADSQFTELELNTEFKVHLASWIPLWESLMGDSTDDADIERQKLALKIYAKYYGARILFTAAPMAFLKSRSDGEVELMRFDTNALENLKAELDAQVAKRKLDVLDISTEFSPEAASATEGQYTQFARAQNSRDVVTE